ncbi:MAG: YncE family protein [Prevotellaceae bacterium]|jgi:hypothetical protein|nr:YncE family protein [Prevotellaceae bacterium]
MKVLTKISIFCAVAVFFCACNPVVPTPDKKGSSVTSFYLLNEGSMGADNASLDFYNYADSTYARNYFTEINPNVVGGLGDVGNDLKIYGSKLYAVINGSNLVVVMDAKTARQVGVVEVPKCRYIAFYNGKAYVSAWAADADWGVSKIGYVVEIDTATFEKQRTVNVGREPEEIEFLGGKMYVANSGSYNSSNGGNNRDSTVSVVNIQSFTEEKKIDVALNLRNLRKDKYGKLYALALGNYGDIDPDIYVIENEQKVGKLGIYASNFCISGDSLYVLSNNTNWETYENIAKYYIYNIKNQALVTENFVTDGSQTNIQASYGIAVNAATKEIFVTDVKDYMSIGEVFCFSPSGVLKWKHLTGVIPSKIAFLEE